MADADGLCCKLLRSVDKQGGSFGTVSAQEFMSGGWVLNKADLILGESIGKGNFGGGCWRQLSIASSCGEGFQNYFYFHVHLSGILIAFKAFYIVFILYICTHTHTHIYIYSSSTALFSNIHNSVIYIFELRSIQFLLFYFLLL